MPRKKTIQDMVQELAVENTEPITTTDAVTEVGFEKNEDLHQRVETLENRVFDIEEYVRVLNSEIESLWEHLEPESSLPEATQPFRSKTYIVRAEDTTVALIAKKVLGQSGRFSEIMALNNLKSQTDIEEGQELTLPLQ